MGIGAYVSPNNPKGDCGYNHVRSVGSEKSRCGPQRLFSEPTIPGFDYSNIKVSQSFSHRIEIFCYVCIKACDVSH